MQVGQELLDLYTGRPLTENDYTRCCIITIDLLMMSRCLPESCRGLKKTYYIKELCVKLVAYQKLTKILLSKIYSIYRVSKHFYGTFLIKQLSVLTTRIYTCVTCGEPHSNPVVCKRPIPYTTSVVTKH